MTARDSRHFSMCEPHNPDNVFNQRTVFVELEGPMAIVFGEATPEQQIQCCKLVSAAFGSPLSEEDFLEREKHLGQQPLTRNHGWRCWCLSPPNKPNHVLATCKTIRRNLLVRDASGSREQQGYCISSVVTDSRYRQLGLASFLLKRVAEWMDGPGDGIASMLYCSIGNVSAPLIHVTLHGIDIYGVQRTYSFTPRGAGICLLRFNSPCHQPQAMYRQGTEEIFLALDH